MLKEDLVIENRRLNAKIDKFEKDFITAMIDTLDDGCDDARQPVRDACETVGISFPLHIVMIKVELEYGCHVEGVLDDEGDSIDFELISDDAD